jgi:uncharacterized membrane protein YhhN
VPVSDYELTSLSVRRYIFAYRFYNFDTPRELYFANSCLELAAVMAANRLALKSKISSLNVLGFYLGVLGDNLRLIYRQTGEHLSS